MSSVEHNGTQLLKLADEDDNVEDADCVVKESKLDDVILLDKQESFATAPPELRPQRNTSGEEAPPPQAMTTTVAQQEQANRRNGRHPLERWATGTVQVAQNVTKGSAQAVTGAVSSVRQRRQHHRKERRKSATSSDHDNDESASGASASSSESFSKKEMSEALDLAYHSQKEYSLRHVFMSTRLDFWTADSTLALLASLALSLSMNIFCWQQDMMAGVPATQLRKVALIFGGPWLLVSFYLGQVVATLRHQRRSRVMIPAVTAPVASTAMASADELFIQKQQLEACRQVVQKERRQEHRVMLHLWDRIPLLRRTCRVIFPDVVTKPVEQVWEQAHRHSKSCLNPAYSKDNLLHFQRHSDPTQDESVSPLIQKLSRYKTLLRRSKEGVSRRRPDSLTTKTISDSAIQSQPSHPNRTKATTMGTLDLKQSTPDSFTIVPIFRLRGCDVLVAEEAEPNAATHPWLLDQGLRDVPTVVVNIMTQWGNMLVYFAMPEWVTDFGKALEEKEDDSADTKALKTFVKADDKDRNDSFRLIPAVLDGPLAVKLMAPPKHNIQIYGARMPLVWYKHDAETAPDGRHLCPIMEAQVDCVSGRVVRGMACLIKKHLKGIRVDLAVLACEGEQNDTRDQPPTSCLGMWRFDYIDVDTCPHLPSRHEYAAKNGSKKTLDGASEVMDPDVIRVSKILCLSTAEVVDIACETP